MEFPQQTHLYIYNYKHQRLHPQTEPFYFFGSGSDGNSVYLKASHLLIDMGFPFKRYLDTNPFFFYDVQYILLTHEHSDHLNVPALFKLLNLYPHLRFLISERMYQHLLSRLYTTNFKKKPADRDAQKAELKNKFKDRFIMIEPTTTTIELYQNHPTLPTITVHPHMVSHGDITNVAYELNTSAGHVLYSSDLDHVFAPDDPDGLNLPLEYDTDGHVKLFNHPFDLIFLEANYDQDILNDVLTNDPDNAHAKGNLRHISEQEAWNYIKYALKPTGLFVPLHASTAYGTLVQDLK